MSNRWPAVVVVLAGACLACAEESPYRRLLQGDDARKAADLTRRVEELWAAGKFAEAVAPAQEELALRQRLQGVGHWEAADAARRVQTLREAARLPAGQQQALAAALPMTAKAAKLDEQGLYSQAEPLVRKALAALEDALGSRHADTADTCNYLAYLIKAQGRPGEAEPLFRKALAVREEVLGLKHPDTAMSYNNLGSNLDAEGRPRDAEPFYRKAAAIQEEVLGPKDRYTALTYTNLAGNLQAQGRAKEAETLNRKALAVFEEVLGPKHPQTALSYNNLATNLDKQGQTREAELLFRKALAIREEVLVPRHPDTAMSYNNLAYSLHRQGRVQEAEPLYRRAVAAWEEGLGVRHALTLRGYENLAGNLQDQGQAKEAEQLFRRTLTVCEQVLGARHPDTAQAYDNLAANLQAQGRSQEAEPLFRKALAVRQEVLGPKHPGTAQSYNNVGFNLQAQGRAKEAEPLFRKALAILEEMMGNKHPDTARSYHNLAANLQAQGRAKEAETLFRNVLAIFEGVFGLNHPYTAKSCSSLAANLQAQGRYKESEPLWSKGTDGVEAARLRLARTTLDRAAAVRIQPQLGLAACRAHLGRPGDAWAAAEAGLARGLLDDLSAGTALTPDPEARSHDRRHAARLETLDRLLTPLLTREKLADDQRRQRDELLRERGQLDAQTAEQAAKRSRRAVLPLAEVQKALAADAALVFWVDMAETGDHWGCVVRRSGPPAWVPLSGSGPRAAWTGADDRLPHLLRDALDHGEPDAQGRAARLAQQRLEPLAPHLAGTAELPAVGRLIVVPAGRMAGVPVEALTDRYLVSYAPSATVFARLRDKHRPLEHPTLLALGDPNFSPADAGPPPPLPEYGLYVSAVLPGGNAARAGLRGGDVLLRYGAAKLTAKADLKIAQAGDSVPVVVWRDGRTLDELRVAPGKLGVVVSDDPPAVAVRKRREHEVLADARRRDGVQPLPGTRLEVGAIAALLPRHKTTLLLDSKASEQELSARAHSGKLKEYTIVHLATHGKVDPVSAAHSALELARDRLPRPKEQARLAAAGKRVPTGRLTVGDIAEGWELDADLVVLSACQTGLGPDGGGEGLLGFSQVLLAKGARSLVLSLWKVDDTATALLMMRFYQNLLGKREGLDRPLPKALALQEAKRWLREPPRAEVEKLAGELAKGSVRGDEEEPGVKGPPREVIHPPVPAGDMPFAHPRFWAAFILIGDPE